MISTEHFQAVQHALQRNNIKLWNNWNLQIESKYPLPTLAYHILSRVKTDCQIKYNSPSFYYSWESSAEITVLFYVYSQQGDIRQQQQQQ